MKGNQAMFGLSWTVLQGGIQVPGLSAHSGRETNALIVTTVLFKSRPDGWSPGVAPRRAAAEWKDAHCSLWNTAPTRAQMSAPTPTPTSAPTQAVRRAFRRPVRRPVRRAVRRAVRGSARRPRRRRAVRRPHQRADRRTVRRTVRRQCDERPDEHKRCWPAAY